jgi:hypothetical protein
MVRKPMRGIMIDLPCKLGIDTGLVYGGKLTCVGVLHRRDAVSVDRGSRHVKSRAIPLR